MIDKIFNPEVIADQLYNLGINPGDTLLININMSEFGIINQYKKKDYVKLFLDYLGEEGTLVALAYTPAKFSITNKDLPFFDGNQRATTGAFPNQMLKYAGAYRTLHPTNSVVAIGKNADYITRNIDENSGAYDFLRRVINLDGKVLLIGMMNYPGFVTHLVQADLKLYKHYWHRFFYKVRLGNKVHVCLDPGGCSLGFDKLYGTYIKNGALLSGYINGAYSLSIKAKVAYKLDYEILIKSRDFLNCGNKECFHCQSGQWRSIWNLPFYLLRRILRDNFYLRKLIKTLLN